VAISTEGKDRAGLEHKALLDSIKPQKPLCLYSDGSKGENGTIGVGVVSYDYTISPPPPTAYMTNIGAAQEVYDGELEGIEKAMLHAERVGHPGPMYIFSDSQAALQRLTSFSLKPGQAA